MSVFHLKIVTADGLFFDGEAASVLVRTIDGDVCILARHIPYLTALGMGECRVTGGNGETRRAACAGGMLSVMNNQVTLAATRFEWAEDIDVPRAEKSLRKYEEIIKTDLDPQERQLVQEKIDRAKVRIKVGK